jgi:hypothetical protein
MNRLLKSLLVVLLFMFSHSNVVGQTGPHWLQLDGKPAIDVRSYGAVGDGVTDDYQAFRDAIDDAGGKTLLVPSGDYRISQTLVVDSIHLKIIGESKNYTFGTRIRPTVDFVGSSTLEVSTLGVTIENLAVFGDWSKEIDGLRVTNNAQLLQLREVIFRLCYVGAHLISGNSQRWTNILAESCQIGFKVSPDSGENTNGCFMVGLRAYSSRQWGLWIASGPGHRSSTWDISTEGGVSDAGSEGGGIKIESGPYYNHFTLYSESNAGDDFDIPDADYGNTYHIRNNSNFPLLTRRMNGWVTQGASIRFKATKVYRDVFTHESDISFSIFSSSFGATHIVRNTTGSETIGLSLNYLTDMDIGDESYLYKDNTGYAISLINPTNTGVNLVGATGSLQVSVKALKKVKKITATEAIVIDLW